MSDFGRPEARSRVVQPFAFIFESLEEAKSFRRDLQIKAGTVGPPDIHKEIDDWLTELIEQQPELPN